jgi:hypothetical protein
MKKTAVIFSSKYGTTQKYATWISEELGADLFDKASVKPSQISYYDIIIYGGGLYAGGISGIKFILKNKPKKLIVFTVGLANPATTDFSAILKKNFDAALLKFVKTNVLICRPTNLLVFILFDTASACRTSPWAEAFILYGIGEAKYKNT